MPISQICLLRFAKQIYFAISKQGTNASEQTSYKVKESQQKYRLGTVSIKILEGLNRFYGIPTSPVSFCYMTRIIGTEM